MAQGIERFSAPPPGDDFDATDEARFRRLIEQFMENADYRVRDVGDDVESLDDRITALEGASDVGAWDLIETQDVSGVASVDFTGFLDSAYRDCVFVVSNLVPATDSVFPWLRTSTDAGTTWDSGTSDYTWAAQGVDSGGARDGGSAGDSKILLSAGVVEVGSAAGEPGISLSLFLRNPSDSGLFTLLDWSGGHLQRVGRSENISGSGARLAAEDVDGVRFLFSSGNVESGQISLYGIKDS